MYLWVLAMPIKVAQVRHVPNEAEREHANNEGYRHRCPSTTESYKVLQSLMFSSTLMGSMGWRDFSKTGYRVLVTKSTVYGFVVQAFLSINVIRWCLIVSAEDQFNVQLIFKLVIITRALETLSHSIGFFCRTNKLQTSVWILVRMGQITIGMCRQHSISEKANRYLHWRGVALGQFEHNIIWILVFD